MSPVELVERIRVSLREAGDPGRAAGQQAYMKSSMPFLGIRVPEVRRITRDVVGRETDPGVLLSAARSLWDRATHREERYAAQAVLTGRALTGDRAAVPLIEHMVRTGRWWDFTDELTGRMAALHDRHPLDTAALVRAWSADDDMWMRRLAILSQLGRRERVDRQLLADVIDANIGDGDFFVRKAIGWALRDVSRTDPDWVRDFVAARELSPLSRREALKHL